LDIQEDKLRLVLEDGRGGATPIGALVPHLNVDMIAEKAPNAFSRERLIIGD
jgi:hypothetical protein